MTIEGEKKKENEEKEKGYYRSERLFGIFKRRFTLPADVESDNVEAKFEDGTLYVNLHKHEQKLKNGKTIELK